MPLPLATTQTDRCPPEATANTQSTNEPTAGLLLVWILEYTSFQTRRGSRCNAPSSLPNFKLYSLLVLSLRLALRLSRMLF